MFLAKLGPEMVYCLPTVIPECLRMTSGFILVYWDELTGFATRKIFLGYTVHIPTFPNLCCVAVSLQSCVPCLMSTPFFQKDGSWSQGIKGCEDLKHLPQMSMCKLTILLMVVGIRHVHPAQPQAAAFAEQLVGWGCSHRASVVRLHTQPLDGKLFRCMGRISSDTDQHSNTSPALQLWPAFQHTLYSQSLPTRNTTVLPPFCSYMYPPFPLLYFPLLQNLPLTFSLLQYFPLPLLPSKRLQSQLCNLIIFWYLPSHLSGMQQPTSIPWSQQAPRAWVARARNIHRWSCLCRDPHDKWWLGHKL